MKFTTPAPIETRQPGINYNSSLFLVGSCFVENIGEKLEYYKFKHIKNPFGILYHPKAIENFFQKVAKGYNYTSNDVFFHNERWHCFDAHSRLSNTSSEKLLKDLNLSLTHSESFLKNTTHIIITLGTSWIYKETQEGKLVANCHKLPQKNFSKELTGVEESLEYLITILDTLKNLNPTAHIIFTVSPVRHLKDGMIENQRSKAHLLTAIHQALEVSKYNTSYFPAYEIMLDELRDYRFYAEDMLHPNAVAISYIWKKFLETWLQPEAVTILDEIEVIQKGLSHRPFNANSAAHKHFLLKLEKRITALKSQFSHLKFE